MINADEKHSLVDVSDHIYHLKCFVAYGFFEGDFLNFKSNDEFGIFDFLTWLELSSDISGVEITPRYSNSVQWCSGAYEYEKQHKQNYQRFAFKISRLLFVWSAFEKLCDIVGINQLVPGKEGPAVKVGKYLEAESISIHPSFIDVWKKFADLYLKHEDFGKSKSQIYPFAEQWSVASLINLARDARNKAVHGQSSLKPPEDYSGNILPSRCYICFIDLAVRAILITIQMLLETFLSKNICEYYSSYDDEDNELDVHQYLITLHLVETEHPDIMHW